MVELNPIKRIMNEYKTLLERYEESLDSLTIADCKRIIGEVKLFWYRRKKYVDYFISHITEKDEVAFLAGAVRLDIENNGHYEYILVGKIRLINDPLLKMDVFYSDTTAEDNFEYINKYLRECIQDMLCLFRKYADDFYILPIEFIKPSDCDEYREALNKTAEGMVLSMFLEQYNDVREFSQNNKSYDDIENNLLPHMREQLIFCGLDDMNESLRDRCTKYLKLYGDKFPMIKTMTETQLFFLMATQFCMQAIGIALTMKNYHMIPFIRNDVVFQYFRILFYSNISNEFSEKNYLDTYIPYVIQKAFDFSDKEYDVVKNCIGNGKLIDFVETTFENEKTPKPGEIVKCVETYMKGL